MPTHFPVPYPDELLYSLIARYHVRSGNISLKPTIEDLFDSRTTTAVIDMPSNIDTLIKRLPFFMKYKPENIILYNTMFPYYTAFLPQERITLIMRSMKGNFGGDIHTRTGIMASSVRGPDFLRFCPKCNENDYAMYGEYYWHRVHQIPGVHVCHIHNVMLQNSLARICGKNKHEFIAADKYNCINRPTVVYSCSCLEKLFSVAKDVSWLIGNYDTVRDSISIGNYVRERYLTILKEKGLATSTGRVFQKEFIKSFKEFYGDDFLKAVQSDIGYDFENNWLSSIVRKHRKSFNPIRHLILIRYLTGNIEEFFKEIKQYAPFGNGPWPCLNAAANHYDKFVVKEITITHCADTKLPVGTFECSCGFIYSRRGQDTSKADLYKVGRIKQFGPIWEEKLRILSEDGMLSLREKARQLKVDPKTIIVHSKKLGLQTKYAIKTNQQITYGNSSAETNTGLLDFHRNAWLTAMKDNPDKSKTELRKLIKGHFAWLYRHDNQWLDENSPQVKKKHEDNARVNWKERDTRTLRKVKDIVKEILAIESKPVRISLSRIGKMSGMLGLLEKNLEKLPKTKAYIQSVIETDCGYRKRRIKWAIYELDNSGIEPKVWNVMRKAGIRSEYKEEIDAYTISEINTCLIKDKKIRFIN